MQLVDRHGGQLTEEGHAVVERARRITAELEAAVADVAALRHEVVGTARIGMIGTTARWLAPLLLDGMAEPIPGSAWSSATAPRPPWNPIWLPVPSTPRS